MKDKTVLCFVAVKYTLFDNKIIEAYFYPYVCKAQAKVTVFLGAQNYSTC